MGNRNRMLQLKKRHTNCFEWHATWARKWTGLRLEWTVVEQPVSVYLINLVSDVGILLCVYEIFKYKKNNFQKPTAVHSRSAAVSYYNFTCSVLLAVVIYSMQLIISLLPRGVLWVTSMSVCVSVQDHIFISTHPIFTNFLCMLPMAMARSSSGGVVTRCMLCIRFYGWRDICS